MVPEIYAVLYPRNDNLKGFFSFPALDCEYVGETAERHNPRAKKADRANVGGS
jgi:hypothetical protein